ncbi:MAG: carbohydrate porin [Gammaproteobacteria bacterium]|nr:carbohydrate porin [Gammaproteobacteria bacterium]
MTRHKNTSTRLAMVLLAAAWMPLTAVFAAPDESANAFDELPMNMNNPGSIVERLEEDAEPKEYLFQLPGVSSALQPWYDFKNDLDRKHGFKFGISYTSYYQKASDSFGPEDDAASFDLDISGSWIFLGRETASPTMLGFNFFWRDNYGSKIPPQPLFTQYGALYSGAAPYGDNDPVVGELWIQKKFNNVFGFRVGKIFPITAYDFFPFKNFRTDFVDFNHVTNAAIPLPGNGLGAFVMYRPRPDIMLRLGAHDANADVEKSGFDTYEGELFTIFEAGFDTGLVPREPGRPPHGHVHVSLWHQDERDDARIDDGWGIGLSAVQRFGRFSPFVRYGYADGGAKGPAPVKHMVNLGLVTDGIFGQDKDRIGVGYTWSDPADSSLDKQNMIDAYYRVQLTPEIEIGPTLEVVFDPVRNPDDDTVYVWGFRARIAL